VLPAPYRSGGSERGALVSGRRRVWKEIDLRGLAENLTHARALVPDRTKILGVVKADAYGHGSIPVSKTLTAAGIDMLGVGDAHEAIVLREAKIETPILVLGATLEREIPSLIAHRVVPSIHSPDSIELFAREAEKWGVQLPVHLLIDCGMGLFGVTPEEALEQLCAIVSEPNLQLAGVGTHIPSPDQEIFCREQFGRFEKFLRLSSVAGVPVPLVHMASSRVLERYPEASYDMVRLGGFLYGLGKSDGDYGENPQPVLSLRTEIVDLRDHPPGTAIGYGGTHVTKKKTRIATLPIGYHDGFPHALSNRAVVLVKGQRAAVIGQVTMDYAMVDVTEIAEVTTGDTATILGQDGEDQIFASDLAEWAGTVCYEIPSRLSSRVESITLAAQDSESVESERLPSKMLADSSRWVSSCEELPVSMENSDRLPPLDSAESLSARSNRKPTETR